MKIAMICSTCKWAKKEKAGTIECHHYHAHIEGNKILWPLVSSYDFCSAWEERRGSENFNVTESLYTPDVDPIREAG